ncbi:Hypothetical protein NGAL_HAMBI1145_09620 [Neorhizobium galegae bv. officinalis]|uniref:Uncharacterized protein n=1 Tax=Neorhizobium galegae bv. officinalis TaxID=323656 RepID=A0A0T7FB65_NEOGA|nr:hypothetical protein [Neorhizobium galegae]CDZ32191.1 Hypothetical protein NGAL_HAMBI1145_09620 [Neorhizobium galegae bv. officinalis]
MATALPLFNWQKQAEHIRLQGDREQLLVRIAKLRPHAHKRLALEERVRQITLRQIELENELFGRERSQ